MFSHFIFFITQFFISALSYLAKLQNSTSKLLRSFYGSEKITLIKRTFSKIKNGILAEVVEADYLSEIFRTLKIVFFTFKFPKGSISFWPKSRPESLENVLQLPIFLSIFTRWKSLYWSLTYTFTSFCYPGNHGKFLK